MILRVLVVDDSKLARIVLTRVIHALHPDWICLEANSAEIALAMLDSEQAHVAVVDFNMPGMNGLALAREIRSRFPAMPIAIVTANIQTNIMTGARAIGAHFVPKPVSEDGVKNFFVEAERRIFWTG